MSPRSNRCVWPCFCRSLTSGTEEIHEINLLFRAIHSPNARGHTGDSRDLNHVHAIDLFLAIQSLHIHAGDLRSRRLQEPRPTIEESIVSALSQQDLCKQ